MDLPSTLQTTPKLPMQLGLPFDDLWSFVLFIACLSAAIGLVYLFCGQKFAERISTGTDDMASIASAVVQSVMYWPNSSDTP